MELITMYQTQSEGSSMEVNPMVSSQPQVRSGLGYVVAGWLAVAISFLFIPILFGAVAFFMGLMTYWERNEAHGAILMGCAAVSTIVGSLLSFLVAGTFFL